MTLGEASEEQVPGAGRSGAESLEARWRHWRVSVVATSPTAFVANVPPENLLQLLGDARSLDGPGFCRLVDLTAVDHGPEAGAARFEVVYWLRRESAAASLRLRVALEAAAPLGIDSVVQLWPAANWLEREVFDLFGIAFRGHPDLRRLLLPADFEGAPLRKDYPRQPNLPLPKPLEATDVHDAPEAREPLASTLSGTAADTQ